MATSKAPAKKSASKSTAKKGPAKKSAAKKAPAKSSAKKSAGKSSGAKTAAKAPAKKDAGRKYSPAASKSVEREMKAMHEGKLKSGGGKKVTNPKQAIAIGLSEARRAGAKVPPPPPRKKS